MTVSIIIPCYNEEKNIRPLIERISNTNGGGCDVEFLIVNNGSTDNTAHIVELCEHECHAKNIKFVTVPKNKGYGYGIKQGIKASSGQYVGWIHGDIQVYPEDLTEFFAYLAENEGEKIFLKGRRKGRKMIENIFTWGMGVVATLIFGRRMKDVMSMPAIANRELFSSGLEDDFGIDIETYYLAKLSSYKVVHLPIIIHARHEGVSSWNTGLKSRIKTSVKMFRSMKKVKKKYKK